jgi:glutamate racemase
MSDVRIGVFDSGIGGLTVVRELQHRLKKVPLVYLGDTARLPYGTKSADTIRKYLEQNVRFLKEQGATHVVVACNSASTVLPDLQPELPCWGVIEAGSREAAARSGRVGVIGTRATIESNAYVRTIHSLDPGREVFQNPAPLLVPLAEEGRIAGTVTETLLSEAIDPLVDQGVETLVLGCTHYPVFRETIERLWPKLSVVDPAQRLAAEVARELSTAGSSEEANLEVYLTDHSPHFEAIAARLLKHAPSDSELVRQVQRDLT